MSGEISHPSSSIPFDPSMQSMQQLIDLLQNGSSFIPPALLSAFLMQYLFAFPAQFPSMAGRQLLPMPQVQEMQRQINKTLKPLEKEIEKTLLSFRETLAKTFPELNQSQGQKMMGFLPTFKALVKELALAEGTFSKPTDAQKLPLSSPQNKQPAQKLPEMVEHAKLASEFLLNAHENTTPLNRFLGKLSNFMETFQKLHSEAEALFTSPQDRKILVEMKGAFQHLERALTLAQERQEGVFHQAPNQGSFSEPIRNELGRFIQEAFRPFMETNQRAPRGEMKFFTPSKEGQFLEPANGKSFFNSSFPKVHEEPMLDHFFKLFVNNQAAPTQTSVHQESTPLGIIAPYSQNNPQDSKNKKLKEKKKEPKSRSYLRDLQYEEELE